MFGNSRIPTDNIPAREVRIHYKNKEKIEYSLRTLVSYSGLRPLRVRAAPQSLGLEWVLTGWHVPSQSSAWVAPSSASWMIALRRAVGDLLEGDRAEEKILSLRKIRLRRISQIYCLTRRTLPCVICRLLSEQVWQKKIKLEDANIDFGTRVLGSA